MVLDTTIYGAHTGTVDALWAGLPVVTCVGHCVSKDSPARYGDQMASRVAASMLTVGVRAGLWRVGREARTRGVRDYWWGSWLCCGGTRRRPLDSTRNLWHPTSTPTQSFATALVPTKPGEQLCGTCVCVCVCGGGGCVPAVGVITATSQECTLSNRFATVNAPADFNHQRPSLVGTTRCASALRTRERQQTCGNRKFTLGTWARASTRWSAIGRRVPRLLA